MQHPIVVQNEFVGCYSNASACTTAISKSTKTAPPCTSGYTNALAKTSCFTCGASNCGTAVTGDDWVATWYRSKWNMNSGGSFCSGGTMALVARQCNSRNPSTQP